MQITILALGSRGDVQPLLALAVGLQLTGRHEVSFVTSNDFERVVRNHGVNFFSLGVNARELLGTEAAWDVLESGRNVIQGMWQIVRMMRPTLEQLVGRVWQASQTAEAIIFSTLGIGAYHIAEKQRLPCFWALPFPFFNRTRSFPNLAFPFLPLGGKSSWDCRQFRFSSGPMAKWMDDQCPCFTATVHLSSPSHRIGMSTFMSQDTGSLTTRQIGSPPPIW
jgi:sterol 3beta-glucosyltransferase